jgi:hypothetical protein
LKPPTDEQLTEWETLFGSAREGDDDTILNLCAIGWRLTQEVRRLKVWGKAATEEAVEQGKRAEKAEAEVEKQKRMWTLHIEAAKEKYQELEAERDSAMLAAVERAEERDRFAYLAGYARHDSGCPKRYIEDEPSCPCGYLQARSRAALNQPEKP